MGGEMTEAEKELDALFDEHFNWSSKQNYPNTTIERLKKNLLAWHLRHSPAQRKVGREEIEKIFERWNFHSYLNRGLISDLLAILNGQEKEPERKTWCEHWRYENGWHFMGAHDPKYSAILVGSAYADDWDICPVKGCHAPRPTS